ncbi:MAG: PadR family transcriptional regulator [Candidatus Heimdallarchaeota archaeon]|nr:MAG: PadR family transcriptional regulator [Candidatus Heimdallarchaeota archaeon]
MSLEERLENEVTANLITFLLLKCVQQYGRSYGYQMKKFIQEKTGKSIPEGTLYPILSKLRDKKPPRYGYLRSFREEVQGGRKRRYYELTERGKSQLKIWPKKWLELNEFVQTILNHLNTE